MAELNLSERERDEIKAYLDRGQRLPARYKALLFEQPHAVELIWPGKTGEVTNVVLPFQQIEQIDEPRREGSDFTDLFAWDRRTGRQTGGWTNKLIWGDNKLVLASLKNGPLRRQIEDAGGLKLVYIDPPFDVGADFSLPIDVGGEKLTKEPTIIEDIAYRDTWGRGRDSYIAMLYERLNLIRSLMDAEGSIFVHVGWQVSGAVRLALDELFGPDQHLNQIIWKRTPHAGSSKAKARKFPVNHEIIYWYSKGSSYQYRTQFEGYSEEYVKRFSNPDNDPRGDWQSVSLKTYSQETLEKLKADAKLISPQKSGAGWRYKWFLSEAPGKQIEDIWTDVGAENSMSQDRTDYPTQKPTAMLHRVLESASNEGDLVADFFCGSGTTLAVAEKLGRKWIGCDLGRFAIHTSRKRLIGVQRELKAAGKPYRSFEILNLGRYERQFFVGIDPTLPEEQRKALSARKEEEFVSLILQAYKAERVEQSPPFHGRKSGAFVVVGPIDAPVTRAQVDDAVEAARAIRAARVDVLGFEFEMGLVPIAQEEARARGVALTLRHIPKDVFDKRAVEKDQVVFHDVSYVEAKAKAEGMTVTVSLTDFGVFYSQGDIDAMTTAMKTKSTKVQVDRGQVWRVAKDKDGIVTREQLTKHWTDWIDYWAVDFNFESKCELVTITDAEGSERQAWTGGYIFENEWQSFRTRRDRTLELTSAEHDYEAEATYKIAVKVIDIFGNDTTKVIEVRI